MKNILYLSSSSESHTGSPKALLDLVAKLDREIYNPILIAPEDGPLAENFRMLAGKTFFRKSVSLSGTNVLKFLKSVYEFNKFYRSNNISLLHFNNVGWRDSAVVAAKLCKLPIVLHLHNNYDPEHISGNFNFYLCDKIIIVSDSMRGSFCSHPRIFRKIICIHNGVDFQKFIEGAGTLRQTLPVGKNALIVGYVGQLCKRKGVDLLIKASVAVVRQYPDTFFIIAGADGVGEEGYTLKMKSLADESGVAHRFLFLGKRTDVPEVMNACDLLVVPSRLEPFGKVIIEAMACRKCVVGSNVGGIPEIIHDGENGRLVPTNDVTALENAILEILGDGVLREKLACNGHRTVHENFSIDALVDKTQNVYSSLMK